MGPAATAFARCGVARLAVIALVAGVALDAAADDRDHEGAAVVELRLSVDDGLSPGAQQVMLEETDAIWRRAGIALRWLRASAASTALPVSVVASDPSRGDHDEEWRLAKFQRDRGRARAAIVSIAAAEQVLARVERTLGEPARLRERRLGLVLGRALAHELGHYLLGSGQHRPSGLMRASIQAAEMAGLSSLGFGLDDDARALARSHVGGATAMVATGGGTQ